MPDLCNASIIILAHNGQDFTRTCLGSLLRTEDLPRELFIVDNGSTDNTSAVIAEFAPRFQNAGVDFVTWRNEENKGCSLARNEAWERATSQYVVFMDNDTAACTRNWLSLLAKTLDAAPDAALVGPKLIYPFQPHPIQCAGVSFNRLGRVAFRGRGHARYTPEYCVPRTVPALISACWIMRNDLRDSIGMLDELFHPVQYEDLDLCLRARRAGRSVLYNPRIEMYHFEGITTASFGQIEYQRNIARNSAKFRERWHAVFPELKDDLPPEEYRWKPRTELELRPEIDLALCAPPSVSSRQGDG